MATNTSSKEHVMWYVDSGYFTHITGDPSIFDSFISNDGGTITFSDNNKGKIIGKRMC